MYGRGLPRPVCGHDGLMAIKFYRIILASVAVIIIGTALFFARECPLDFPQYYAAGKLFVLGRAPEIYQLDKIAAFEHASFPKMPVHHEAFPNFPADPIPFWYPPFAAPYFSWLALFSPAASVWAWEILSLISLGVSLWLLQKAFSLSKTTMMWAAIVIALSGPCAHALVLGQPTFFLLLALSLAIWGLKGQENGASTSPVSRRHAIAAVVGLAILSMKPNIALPIYMFLFGARRYRLLAQVVGAGVGLLAFSLLTEGVATYQSYFEALKYVAAGDRIVGLDGCVTIQAQLLRLLPEHKFIIGKLTYGLWALVLAVIFWIGNRFRQSDKWLETGLVAAIPLGLVTAPYLHPYDLMLWVPSFLAFCTMPFTVRIPKDRLLLALSGAALFFALVYSSIYKAHPQLHVHVWALLAYAALFTGTVLRNSAQFCKSGTEVR
jgi:hypothetical protein